MNQRIANVIIALKELKSPDEVEQLQATLESVGVRLIYTLSKGEITSRKENIEVIESLYGLDEDDVKDLLEVIGFQALSDEAIEMLAERQQARERRYSNLPPVVIGAAKLLARPTVCQCGDDCVPMIGEDICVRCELPLAHNG